MSEKWDENSSLSSLTILVGMLFGPTNLFEFRLEIMLVILFLLVGNKKNEFEELFSMYSEKCLREQFTLALFFSAAETKCLLKIYAIWTGFVTVFLLCFKVLGTLLEIYFNVINDFIPFQVFLILFQLNLKNFKK